MESLEDLIKIYENEINVEKLSGNVVKEAQAKGIVMGLRMAQSTRPAEESGADLYLTPIDGPALGGDWENWSDRLQQIGFLNTDHVFIRSEDKIVLTKWACDYIVDVIRTLTPDTGLRECLKECVEQLEFYDQHRITIKNHDKELIAKCKAALEVR